MNVADITIHRPAELRRVGITFDTRTRVMDTAVRIYRDLGIALDVDELTISILCPRPAGAFYMGMMERYTGFRAFNDWETP